MVDEGNDGVPSTPRSDTTPAGVGWIFALSLAVLVATLGWLALRGLPGATYESSSPNEMLVSMTRMVERGEPGRLTELVEAAPRGATDQERAYWDAMRVRLGRVLDAAWALGLAINEEFPEEVEALRAASREGDRPGLGAMLGGGGRMDAMQDAIGGILTDVLTDPFAALQDGAARVSFDELSDDEVAVLIDDEPVLPPFGLTARRCEDGRWRVVLPTSSPLIARFMPSTRGEFAALASILATAENILIELRRDVERGRFATVEEVGDDAVRRAILPVGMAFAALDRARRGDRDQP